MNYGRPRLPAVNSRHSQRFWALIPEDTKARISDEDKAVLTNAVFEASRIPARANVKLHLGRYFIAIFAGHERRSRERLDQDRLQAPFVTWHNLPILGTVAIAATSIAYVLVWGVTQIVVTILSH